MIRRRIPLPVLLAVPALAALATPRAAQEPNERARALFLKNCATCHGETGDGKGVTQLDRPARSFMDGGFSFGNTPEALFRTISVGIPGTPMPGFDSSLSEEERKLVASYVVTLGPPVEAVKEEDMILEVHDKPLIVRGLLPSLGEGLPTHPRGLLIGDPTGMTFEYRVDDVRLLALRQGGFVKRTDWTGRGGTALEPLGKVVHLVEGGKPEALFLSKGRALQARLSGTGLRFVGAMPSGWKPPPDGERRAELEYHLVLDGRELAHVTESPWVLTRSIGTGYERFMHLPGPSSEISVRTPAFEAAEVLAKGGENGRRWQVVRASEGQPTYTSIYIDCLPDPPGVVRDIGRGQFEATISPQPGVPGSGQHRLSVILHTIVLVDWNADILKQVESW